MCLHPFKSAVDAAAMHATSVSASTTVTETAILHHLFRVFNKLSVGGKVSALHGSGGGKGPTGIALTLILDRGNTAPISPIDWAWKLIDIYLETWLVRVSQSFRYPSKPRSFLFSPISILVYCKGVRRIFVLIVWVDFLIILHENFLSHSKFLII